MKNFKVLNIYRGNTLTIEFETFEEAKVYADQIGKKRKNPIIVYKFIREGDHMWKGHKVQHYREVYATNGQDLKNALITF